MNKVPHSLSHELCLEHLCPNKDPGDGLKMCSKYKDHREEEHRRLLVKFCLVFYVDGDKRKSYFKQTPSLMNLLNILLGISWVNHCSHLMLWLQRKESHDLFASVRGVQASARRKGVRIRS